MAVTDGHARDDVSVMIDVVCHEFGRGLEPHIRAELEKMLQQIGMWTPWVLVLVLQGPDGIHSRSWGMHHKPSTHGIAAIKRELNRYKVSVVKTVEIDMRHWLKDHIEIAASEAIAEDDPNNWLVR